MEKQRSAKQYFTKPPRVTPSHTRWSWVRTELKGGEAKLAHGHIKTAPLTTLPPASIFIHFFVQRQVSFEAFFFEKKKTKKSCIHEQIAFPLLSFILKDYRLKHLL